MFTVEGWSGEKTIVCGEGPVDIYRLWEGVGIFFWLGAGGITWFSGKQSGV